MTNWEDINWENLQRIRESYLRSAAPTSHTSVPSYWENSQDLRDYDWTFATRIGWKWEAVFRELLKRQWNYTPRSVTDWGCGTAVATRTFLRFSPKSPQEVFLWDRAPLACDYARTKILEQDPSLVVKPLDRTPQEADLLLVSHVLSEIDASTFQSLENLLLLRSQAIIWVEPGTPALAQTLATLRERALKKGFHVIGPCTHNNSCGMLSESNSAHWCHTFASTPQEAHQDAGWRLFSQKMGIDLRSLPYCYLALVRDRPSFEANTPSSTRMIGRPRLYKGYSRALLCDAQGVREETFQKKEDPALYKRFKKEDDFPFFHFERRDGKMRTAASDS